MRIGLHFILLPPEIISAVTSGNLIFGAGSVQTRLHRKL
jgi:hypothetical protein